jgi:hypothetical protein
MKTNNNAFALTLLFVLVITTSAFGQTATAPSGSGTSGDPYLIATLNNLYWITQNSGSWSSSFVQTADIDASSDSSWNSGGGFTPIGTPATFFTGTFDGGGHSITGLFIHSSVDNSAGWGLFAAAKNATIKNIRLLSERVIVTASGSDVGGLIGSNMGSSIDSCSTSGVIYGGGHDAGGLAGFNNDDLGISSIPHITRSYSSASVSGGTQTDVGGLVGQNYTGVVDRCYSTGNVIDDSIGANVGGLVGLNTEGATISNCYSTGNATGTGSSSDVGGLAGYNYGVSTISNCYSTGMVTGSSSYGGLLAYSNSGTISNCFWDTQTSGQTFSGGGMGESTSQMKTQSTFASAGWDFSGTWALDPTVNNGYPGFFWQPGYTTKSPVAATASATAVTASTATLNGTASPYRDTTIVKFVYGTSSGVYPDTVSASQSPIYGYGATPVSKSISALAGSTTYYYRVIVSSSLGSNAGSEVSFTTLPPASAPTAVTDSVSSVGTTTVTAYGTVNPNGDTTKVEFLYGTVSGSYTDSVTATQSPLTGYSSTHVSANLSGLTSGQTYYLRVSASNSLGYVCGSEISFATTAVIVFTETAPSGSGTSGDPHIIANRDNLAWLQDASNDTAWGDYYRQNANIEAAATLTWNTGAGLLTIGTSSTPFSGTYDGQGHTIDSLHVLRTGNYYQGLFGVLGSTAVVENLGVTNASVSGYDFVGALTGWVESGASVRNCYSTGSVHASYGDCGGLVGENDGSIATSYSSSMVTGGSNYSMGGLVGYAAYSVSDSITDCYSTGKVNVSCPGVGGLVGNNSGAVVRDCYSVSKVSAPNTYGGLVGGQYGGSVTNSFYDTDSTASSAAGTAKTSVQMRTASTFTGASWDFVLESTNGTNDYWDMDTTHKVINSGYPFLHWQNGSVVALPVELASFAATSNRLNAELQWTATTQVDNEGWDVERKAIANFGLPSADWVNAGLVKGAGTSTQPLQYSFVDRGLAPGLYFYRLKQTDRNGAFKYSQLVQVNVGSAPRVFTLSQNYPNPFNPTTTIEFTLPADGRVVLKVYDIVGREVATLIDENRNAGVYHQAVFDGSRFASSVYFARLEFAGRQLLKKMLMVK